jgi:hypothetical protein
METLGSHVGLDGPVDILPFGGFLQRLGFDLERRSVARDPGIR